MYFDQAITVPDPETDELCAMAARLNTTLPAIDSSAGRISGGSVIIAPMGEVLSAAFRNEETLICADIDLNDLTRARYDFDVTGYGVEPDLQYCLKRLAVKS